MRTTARAEDSPEPLPVIDETGRQEAGNPLRQARLTIFCRKNIMGKKSILSTTVLLLITAMLAFVSCQAPENEVPDSASLTVRVADMTSARTISPSGNVDVSHYKITVNNADEDVTVVSEFLAKGETFSVTNVPAGIWTATVDAYVKNGETGGDSDYVKVASATSAETRVSSGEETTLTVVLETLDDTASGAVTVTLKMPSELDDLSDAFWYTYTIKGTGQRSDVEIDHSTRESGTTGADGLATISISESLNQGSYLLTVTVYDSADAESTNVTRQGVEIMRLLPGLTATGTINLDSQEVLSGGFKISVTDKVGNLLKPTTSDGQTTYTLDASADSDTTSFTVTLSQAVPDGFVMEWYVDGVKTEATTSDDTSFAIALNDGLHSVVGIMRDDSMLMSVGSVSFDVNVEEEIQINPFS